MEVALANATAQSAYLVDDVYSRGNASLSNATDTTTLTWAGELNATAAALLNATSTVGMSETFKRIATVKTVTVFSIILSMMTSMGCVITVQETLGHLRRPFGILIGFLCQYGILPLTAFGLCHAFRLETMYAIGVLIMSCCPGGTSSNIVTYWIKGDVSLSLCMTTCSTVFAFGMMPLLLFVYSRSWTTERALIPYTKIVISLITIVFPVLLGMLIRHKSKTVAERTSKVLAIVALIGVALNMIFEAILRSHVFTSHPELWAIGFILPTVGGVLSYLTAWLLRLPPKQRRTVAVETSLQNLGVALTLIVLTFPESAGQVGAFVTVYSAIQTFAVYLPLVFTAYVSTRTRYSPVKEDTDAGEAGSDHGKDQDEDNGGTEENTLLEMVTQGVNETEENATVDEKC